MAWPDRRFHSLGKGATQARRAQLWSTEGSARAMWNKEPQRSGMDDMCEGWMVRASANLFVKNAGLQEIGSIYTTQTQLVECIPLY